MTKAELVEIVSAKDKELADLRDENKRLNVKIVEQKHLGEAVNAKDAEISKAQNDLAELREKNTGLQKTIENQKHLAEAVNAKDKEIADKNREVEQIKKEYDAKGVKLREEFEAKMKTQGENLQAGFDTQKKQMLETIKALQAAEQRRVREVNKWMIMHGHLLKSLQGTLDTAIIANDYMCNEISKQGE